MVVQKTLSQIFAFFTLSLIHAGAFEVPWELIQRGSSSQSKTARVTSSEKSCHLKELLIYSAACCFICHISCCGVTLLSHIVVCCCGGYLIVCCCLVGTWLVEDGAARPSTSPFSPDLSARPFGTIRLVTLINVVIENLNDCQGGKRRNIQLSGDSESSKPLNEKWTR